MAKEMLSVELDAGLVERLRRYSEAHGTDVSNTIGELIDSLPSGRAGAPEYGASVGSAPAVDASEDEWVQGLPPITRSLWGIASGDAGEEDYKEYLWRKYGP